jgi:hypothetical protein
MTTPVHELHIYEKPRVGSAFLRKYPALQYRHRILAIGGFDTASCSVPVQRAEGEWLFENCVGNRVAVIVDNPFEPAFDGYISRITFTLPGIVLTRSLDETGNRILINAAPNTNAATPTISSTVNNTASQAVYGIKAKTERSARNHGVATYQASLSARMLNDLAYPLTSVASNAGNVDALIELEIKGFYHTLDWENSDVVTGTRTCRNGTTGWFDVFLTLHANGTTFISSSTRDLTNNLQTYPGVADGGTIWKKMAMLAECGDNAQRWVCGVGPYDWNISSRRLYYRPSDTTVKYTARVNAPGRLFSPQGAPVSPWTVKADGVVRIIDALVGWDADGLDPREAYIAALEYDADSGQVNWQSDDNIAIQGALQVDKWHTSSDQLYGQRASNPLM